MPSVVLYHSPYSPPSRSVLLLSRFLNLDVDVKILDLLKGEQLSPEFLRINPQHCVPTINDNGFHLWESRAILSYLMESRAPELSPSSPQAKAILNQRLYFELGDLASKYAAIYRPLFAGETEMDREKIKELYVTLRIIDEFYFPNGSKWIAGENITVADFAYVATISGLIETGAKLDHYPRLQSWFTRCKSTFPDYEEANGKGAKMFGDWVASRATNCF